MALKNNRADEKYISILSDGTFRLVVPEGTEGAVKRDYETSDGKTGSKFELVFTELSGTISNVSMRDGEYGKNLQLVVEDGAEEPVVLSVNTSSSFGEDLMKKLPNVDITKPVKLVPYAFEDEKGKKRKGITVYQDGKKVNNYYYDIEANKVINGYPEPNFKKKVPTSDDWKLYFLNARVFLVEEMERIFKLGDAEAEADALFNKLSVPSGTTAEKAILDEKKEAEPEDIPFD